MKNVFAMVACVTMLTACIEVEVDTESPPAELTGPSAAIVDALTGAVTFTKYYVQDVTDTFQYVRADITGRIDKIGEGLDALKEGKELIDEGLSAGTGSSSVN